MNPLLQRYLPPVMVLGAAAYFAWPPAAPLDLGDDLIRTTSVRWRPDDLATPERVEVTSDPFAEVLVASQQEVEAKEAATAEVPKGPPQSELQSGLRLDGFATMAGRQWAIVNGRPRLPGDLIRTDGTKNHLCRLEAVQTQHIVVRCEDTVAKIHLQAFGSRKTGAPNPESLNPESLNPDSQGGSESTGQTINAPSSEVPPPHLLSRSKADGKPITNSPSNVK